MQKGNILVGYTTQLRPFTVNDYPYGFTLRTSIHYWIESKPGKGDRFCSYTINPKNGRPNKPKYSTYAAFMYLYLDENGHVKHGQIDAYDKELFEARFEFIKNKIGIDCISDVQKNNLRTNYGQHVYFNAPYHLERYSEERKPLFKQWVSGKLKHIKTCDFKDLTEYPEQPEYDLPEQEIKATITQY